MWLRRREVWGGGFDALGSTGFATVTSSERLEAMGTWATLVVVPCKPKQRKEALQPRGFVAATALCSPAERRHMAVLASTLVFTRQATITVFLLRRRLLRR